MSIARRTEWALDTEGRGIAGALVTVRTSTGALATLYTDIDGETSLVNPVRVDTTGKYTYCAETGIYNETIVRAGYETLTVDDAIVGLLPGAQGPSGSPVTTDITPLVNGDAAVGTSPESAHADHVHPEQTVWEKVQTFTNAVNFMSTILVNGMATASGFLANGSQGFTMVGNLSSSLLFYDQDSSRSGEVEFTYNAGTDKVQVRLRADATKIDSAKLGVYGVTPVARQTVTGAKGDNEALANLLSCLANLGLIIDGTGE